MADQDTEGPVTASGTNSRFADEKSLGPARRRALLNSTLRPGACVGEMSITRAFPIARTRFMVQVMLFFLFLRDFLRPRAQCAVQHRVLLKRACPQCSLQRCPPAVPPAPPSAPRQRADPAAVAARGFLPRGASSNSG